MDSTAARERSPRLSRAWRRALVVMLVGSATTLIALHLLLADGSGVLYPATLILVPIAGAALWLLLDVLRPWFGDRWVSAEERAHADAALRQSYTALLWAAMGVLVYLTLAGSRPTIAPDGPHHAEVILWSTVALVFLLPVAIAAWGDMDDPGVRSVGPIALSVARFRGPSGGTYLAGAVALAVAAALLLLWSGAIGRPGERVMKAAVVGALGIVAILMVTQVRNVLGDRGVKGHGRRR